MPSSRHVPYLTSRGQYALATETTAHMNKETHFEWSCPQALGWATTYKWPYLDQCLKANSSFPKTQERRIQIMSPKCRVCQRGKTQERRFQIMSPKCRVCQRGKNMTLVRSETPRSSTAKWTVTCESVGHSLSQELTWPYLYLSSFLCNLPLPLPLPLYPSLYLSIPPSVSLSLSISL